jgi:DNA ligase-1
MSRFSRHEPDADGELLVRFFDVLHVDGTDLIDEPLDRRLAVLAKSVADPYRVPGIVTADADEAQSFADEAISLGHEGVMVKALTSAYEAGRRGSAWRKVKPVKTLDLVVLGAEWGHGRRRGWLSNLHLGARDPDSGGFLMVGKTFKGLTDALLTWQTDQLLARETHREGITVFVRPELVVEIALDGAQRSPRYPGGVALRFARVKGYRDDKSPADADTIDAVRALLP